MLVNVAYEMEDENGMGEGEKREGTQLFFITLTSNKHSEVFLFNVTKSEKRLGTEFRNPSLSRSLQSSISVHSLSENWSEKNRRVQSMEDSPRTKSNGRSPAESRMEKKAKFERKATS